LASPALSRTGGPLSAASGFVRKTIAIAEIEARKLRHDPSELLVRAVQPALWLLVFGQVFTRVRAIPTGNVRYIDFMAPGILAQSVLFVAIFSGMAIIWERDLESSTSFWPAPRRAPRWCSARRSRPGCAAWRKQRLSISWRCCWACR